MSDWKEIKRPFREALIAAFNWDRLALVLIYHCDRRLDRITSKNEGFDNNVDDVIADAIQTGWLEKLAEGALAENEKHTSLQATVPHILKGVAAEGRAYYQGQAEGEKAARGRPGEHLSIFSVPQRRNRNFSGREAQLSAIGQRLAAGETTLAIAGLGGLGKTQLALEFCYRNRDAYELIYWLNADEAAALGASLAALAQDLGFAAEEMSDQEVLRKQLFNWLESTEARWLLVYDNADTMKPRELNDYLPRSGSGHALITSRNSKFGGIAGVLELGVFEPDEALAFLQKRSGRDDREGAQRLAEALGYLPLALEHAATYVYETGASFTAYQGYYKQQRQALWADIEPPDAYHGTVSTTWELNLEQLQEQEAAIQLLELCSFLAPEDIPLSLLQAAAGVGAALPEALHQALENPLALDKAIAGLQRFSLLVREEDSLEMHRLVQVVMRDRLGVEQARDRAAAAASMLLAAFPEDSVMWHTWREGPRLLAHAAAAAGHADQRDVEPEQVASLYGLTGYYLSQYGDYAGARPYYERALAIREKVLGAEHPDTAESLNNLGALLQASGEYEAARPYYERALAINEKALGTEHPDTANSLNNLGFLLRASGEYEAARPYYERALAIREKVLGAEHPDTAGSLNNLGALLQASGEYEVARPYYERALAIIKEKLGPQHPYTKIVRDNLDRLVKESDSQ